LSFTPLARRKRQIRPCNKLQYSSATLQSPGKKAMPRSRPRRSRTAAPFMERRAAMKAMILAASAALMLTTVAASAAEPGCWSAHWTGPNGGVYEGSGKCADGVCQSSGTFTGPHGGVWHHAGNAHRVAPGQWAGEGQITGPGGGTLQHSWTWHRAGM
jgi:uncharacterized protein (DUF2147 family)